MTDEWIAVTVIMAIAIVYLSALTHALWLRVGRLELEPGIPGPPGPMGVRGEPGKCQCASYHYIPPEPLWWIPPSAFEK